jgi:hypothetical protein
MILAYTRDYFGDLMRDGTGVGGRKLEAMSDVATHHLSHLDAVEVDALFAYLKSLGPGQAPE